MNVGRLDVYGREQLRESLDWVDLVGEDKHSSGWMDRNGREGIN